MPVFSTPINYNLKKLQIQMTNRCNFTCSMCNAIIKEDKTILSKEAIEKAILDADKLGFDFIEISGGEPFLAKYMHELVYRYAGNIRPALRICTNAYLLDKEYIESLKNRPKLQFQVSFDGLAAPHNTIRVQNKYDAFSKSEEAISLMLQNGLKVSFNTVIQRQNIGSLLDMYRHFKKYNYEYHGFDIPAFDSANMDEISILPSQAKEAAEELRQIVAEAKRDGKKVGIGDGMIETVEKLAEEKSEGDLSFVHPGYGCTVPFSTVIIFPNGNVFPCMHTKWEDEGDFNINTQSLEGILFSDTYLERSAKYTGKDGCKGCTTACYFHDLVFKRKCLSPTKYDLLLKNNTQL